MSTSSDRSVCLGPFRPSIRVDARQSSGGGGGGRGRRKKRGKNKNPSDLFLSLLPKSHKAKYPLVLYWDISRGKIGSLSPWLSPKVII